MFPAGYAHENPIIHQSRVYLAHEQALCSGKFESATEASYDLLQGIIDEHGPDVHLGDRDVSESLLSYTINTCALSTRLARGMSDKVLPLIRYIISQNASVSPGPLTRAAYCGIPEILSEILRHCDDANDHFPEEKMGYTALCCLVTTGGVVLSRIPRANNDLYQARFSEIAACINILVDHGADSRCMGSSKRSAWLECLDSEHPLRHLIITRAKSAAVQ